MPRAHEHGRIGPLTIRPAARYPDPNAADPSLAAAQLEVPVIEQLTLLALRARRRAPVGRAPHILAALMGPGRSAPCGQSCIEGGVEILSELPKSNLYKGVRLFHKLRLPVAAEIGRTLTVEKANDPAYLDLARSFVNHCDKDV